MKSSTYCAIALFCVAALFGIVTTSAQSPMCRARTPDLRAVDAPNSTDVGDISNNWWGAVPPAIGSFVHFSITVDGGSPLDDYLSAPLDAPTVHCGDYGARPSKKVSHVQSIEAISSCDSMLAEARSWEYQRNYKPAYDTMRYYIDHCYPTADPDMAFGGLNSSAGIAVSTTEGRLEIRNWLFSVLSYRSDDAWFCACVGSIGLSFGAGNDKAGLALAKFLIDNPRCAFQRKQNGNAYANLRADQVSVWQDTASNPDLRYFDSTLPSMHDIGLDSVLKIAAGASVHYEALGSQILLSAVLSPNPVTERTSLAISVGREAYVHIEVYDLIGNKLRGVGYEGVFESGSRNVELDLHSLPSGTYYVHISTANNEVRTIRLVKK